MPPFFIFQLSEWGPTVAAIAGSAAVALISYGAMRQSLRDMKGWLAKVETRMEALTARVNAHGEQLAEIRGEQKVAMLARKANGHA